MHLYKKRADPHLVVAKSVDVDCKVWYGMSHDDDDDDDTGSYRAHIQW